jgi:hypothetical protein
VSNYTFAAQRFAESRMKRQGKRGSLGGNPHPNDDEDEVMSAIASSDNEGGIVAEHYYNHGRGSSPPNVP